MTKRLLVLVFLAIASLSRTNEVPDQISLKVVEVGGNVTMHCPVSKADGQFFRWYKQPLGHMFQMVASKDFTGQKLSGEFSNGRFKLTEGDSQYSLTIKNIKKEDEATYFCQSGTAYFQSFAAGIYLAVNDCKRQTLTHVRQTPETTSVQEGDTVSLNCSLLSKSRESTSQNLTEYSVYWFRVGSGESHPRFLYTQNSRDSCNTSCVYQLSKTIQNSSDTGIYYCAVATCGQILFGEGTRVETSSHITAVFVLGVLLAFCAILIVALIFYIKQPTSMQSKEANRGASGRVKSLQNQPSGTDVHGDEVNYVALNFSTKKTKSVKRRTESPPECVYSTVRAGHSALHENVLEQDVFV